MATKVEIIVTISPSGEVHVKTHGLKGADCIEETKSLEKALGPITSQTKTSEYYEKAPQKAQIKTK